MSIDSQQSWDDKRAALNEALATTEYSPSELCKLAGVDYFSAYRALRSGVRNRTKAAERLSHALLGGDLKSQQSQHSAERKLCADVAKAWDGTDEHATLIVELATITSRYRAQRDVRRERESETGADVDDRDH